LHAADAEVLAPVPTRDSKIVRRFALPGEPRGVAAGADGTLYVGLAQPQAVIAVDPKSGAVKNRLVLDSAEIASTKELVTLRTNRAGTRLYIANGSDESTTILSLPEMAVLREITIEGEPIRDALPDPKGRFLYLLGHRVHVYDANGERELRSIAFDDPMAVAASANGDTLAVVGTHDYGNVKATAVALYDTTTWSELTRDPLQTEKPIEAALFAAGDRALIAVGRDALYEKPLVPSATKTMTSTGSGDGGRMRMTLGFGDLVSSERICLPANSGPQIASLAAPDLLLFAERRCSSSGAFTASARLVTPASLYGIDAYALAYDKPSNTLAVTDRAGYLTIYKVPRAAVAR
jgi:DNA-binding beta-propeller fold protein YncE